MPCSALALSLLFPYCAPRKPARRRRNPTVYANPRAPSDDPRIGLKGGLYDAGEAAFGLERLVSLPKPPGFAPGDDVTAGPPGPTPAPPPAAGGRARPPRPSQYGSTNSDLAFSGNHLFVGNYNGINFYDIDNPAKIKLRDFAGLPRRPGRRFGLWPSAVHVGRGDQWTDRLRHTGNPAAGGLCPAATPAARRAAPARAGARPRPPPPPSPDRFRGVRIFDISDLSNPKQVAAVQSCRGSHTHSLLIDPKDKDNVYIYISGTGNVRQEEELAGCSGGDPRPIPIPRYSASTSSRCRWRTRSRRRSYPARASLPTRRPALSTASGKAATTGTARRPRRPRTNATTSRCIRRFGLAAGACSGNGILLDISDPVHPVRIDAVSDPNYAFWHSANFSNDGTKVLFTDEWGGGGQPRCRATDPMNWGADAIFTLSNRKLTLASYYKMPAPQTEIENCVAHNGSLVPIPGRDIEVQAWYQGGVSMVDFTDAAHPFEIAYFDRGPVDQRQNAPWAAIGRPIGTTATSTVRRLRAVLTCSS